MTHEHNFEPYSGIIRVCLECATMRFKVGVPDREGLDPRLGMKAYNKDFALEKKCDLWVEVQGKLVQM